MPKVEGREPNVESRSDRTSVPDGGSRKRSERDAQASERERSEPSPNPERERVGYAAAV
ncbi:MAG: hypothetical protein ACKVS9_03225 [Phycisphaerae bacterium]